MHKAKNIYFLLIEKKNEMAQGRGGPKQGTFPYLFLWVFSPLKSSYGHVLKKKHVSHIFWLTLHFFSRRTVTLFDDIFP